MKHVLILCAVFLCACGGGGDDEAPPENATRGGGVEVPGGTTYFGDGQNPDGNLGVYNDCAEQKPPTCERTEP